MSVLEQPVASLAGVGEKRRMAYARVGVFTLRDLLYYFPRAYEPRGDIRLLSQCPSGRKCAVVLTMATAAKTSRVRGRMNLTKLRGFDDSGTCELVFFNQDYLSRVFSVGARFRFWGTVVRRGHSFVMTAPCYEPWDEAAPPPVLYPVYPLTEGLSHRLVADHVRQALALVGRDIPDPLPATIRQAEGFCPLGEALQLIHCPPTFDALERARQRLAYDEWFAFALGLRWAAACSTRSEAPRIQCADQVLKELTDSLPYALTGAQRRAIDQIREDMAQPVAMNRMVVGDVGCGKTICAAAAMLLAVRAGRQAALMAPTGILAQQHAHDLLPLFRRLGVRGALLVGHTPATEKMRICESLKSSDPNERLDVVIGTQALLSEGVAFAAPGVVVTDEQHRFGVAQRGALSEKNQRAHMLFMSATPIPRSLALILYGNMDRSVIDEMPPGRQRVDTFVVDDGYRARLEQFMVRQVREGGQVYVVCPAVEERSPTDEEEAWREGLVPLSATSMSGPRDGAGSLPPALPTLRSVVQYTSDLQRRLPPEYAGRVAFVHGRMKQAEKDAVMESFASGQLVVLVSTTVIEVGVNVPNACLMIVENAERFGLSQLHQLRGRVGRGTRKSYCVLVRGNGSCHDANDPAGRRLEVMRRIYDGYSIAEQDLAQRGPGDFLPTSGRGIRQSGAQRLRMAEASGDISLMERCFREACRLLEQDPALRLHPLLREQMEHLARETQIILN